MPHQAEQRPVELTGEVRAVELNADSGGAFQLRLENGDVVPGNFTAEQEPTVVRALRGRNDYRLKIAGLGDFSAAGRLKRILRVDSHQLEWLPILEDPEMPTLLHILKEIHKKYPPDTWDNVPTDGAKNMHHYLYGRPKVDD